MPFKVFCSGSGFCSEDFLFTLKLSQATTKQAEPWQISALKRKQQKIKHLQHQHYCVLTQNPFKSFY